MALAYPSIVLNIMDALGIDIGGSGIKGAPVDSVTGTLKTSRHRIATPQPSTPDAVIATTAMIVDFFDWDGPIGVTFPSVVQGGVTKTAANVDQSWIGAAASELLESALGRPVALLNDADAAGLAEMSYGVGRGVAGVVVMLTFGTGIGSGLFVDGRLVPNTELGHLEMHGMDAEHYAAGRIQEEDGLSFDDWGDRVNEYLNYVHRLVWPDLIIVGGGISKEWDSWSDRLAVPTRVVPAELRNDAGIVGAAVAAL